MKPRFDLSPLQSISLGYLVLAVAGALLLMLPIASEDGSSQSFVDAFFISSSAITTTGLAVVDPGGYYSLFGEVVVLVLFQIGGLGYMIAFGTLLYLFRRKPSLEGRIAFQESLAGITLSNARAFIRALVLLTVAVEAAGAVALAFLWRNDFPPAQALYQGFFHSVSTFCTAGFSLFPDSISRWRDDLAVNAVILASALIGASGYFVLFDVGRWVRGGERKGRLSAHSRLSIAVSAAVLAVGTGVLLLAERPDSAPDAASYALRCLFQAASASTTTGFNTVEIGAMAPASLFALVILMFIGAAPGSTGGGIKTTTFGAVSATAVTTLRGGGDVNVFHRRIPPETVRKALTITLFSLAILAADMLILCVTEEASFLALLFECASALGTVGLSMGVTPKLGVVGKVVISITMLIGRVGPLAVGLSLTGRKPAPGYRYPEADIFVG